MNRKLSIDTFFLTPVNFCRSIHLSVERQSVSVTYFYYFVISKLEELFFESGTLIFLAQKTAEDRKLGGFTIVWI
jgi:hypothetical protein